MSTPLFISEATIFPTLSGGGLITGVSLTSQPTWNSGNTVVPTTTEQTLIEKIRFCAQAFSTDAGQLVLSVATSGNSPIVLATYDIPAGTSTRWSSGELRVNVLLPVGWKLHAQHDVQKSASYVQIAISAHGGVVR